MPPTVACWCKPECFEFRWTKPRSNGRFRREPQSRVDHQQLRREVRGRILHKVARPANGTFIAAHASRLVPQIHHPAQHPSGAHLPQSAAVRHRLRALQDDPEGPRADDGARDEANQRDQRADGVQVPLPRLDGERDHRLPRALPREEAVEGARQGRQVRLPRVVHQARAEAQQGRPERLRGADDPRVRARVPVPRVHHLPAGGATTRQQGEQPDGAGGHQAVDQRPAGISGRELVLQHLRR